MILVLAYLVSLIPGVAVFFWLRNVVMNDPENPDRKKNCSRALGYGALCTLAVTLASGTFVLIGGITGARGLDLFVYQLLYDFFVLAFAEEIVKFATSMYVKKKSSFAYSALDVVITMALVALGFEFVESLVYAFGTNAIQMLVRGLTLMHLIFGFIMGIFAARAIRTGNKAYYVPAVVVPWLIHGLFDFSLSEEAMAASDAYMFIALLLAFLSLVMVFVFIFFVLRAHKDPKWTEPISSVRLG